MSVVACKVYENKIVIGSDSISCRCWTQRKNNNPKGFTKLSRVNNIIIGGVGYSEEVGLFHNFCLTHSPKDPTIDSILAFLCEFSAWKQKLINKHQIENEYLIVYKSKAFHINEFFVEEVIDYEAIGAGMDYALSALYLGHDVYKAIEVAYELCAFCEKPINVIEVDTCESVGDVIAGGR